MSLRRSSAVWLGLLLSAPAWAHGQQPEPLTLDELLSNLALMLIVMGMTVVLARQALGPWLKRELEGPNRHDVLVWGALSLAIVVGMAWWITRQTLYEAFSPPPPREELHNHHVDHGGQVGMFGDYHFELARVRSGEYRLWVTDAYRRRIAARHIRARLVARDPQVGLLRPDVAHDMEASLDDGYLFALLPQDIKSVQLQVQLPSLREPIRLNFVYDGTRGHQSLTNFCGPQSLDP